MEREQIERHLMEATAAIAQGAEKIVAQQSIIAGLEGTGRDTAEASRLLAELQQKQIMHFADRDRLLMALAKVATEDTIAKTGARMSGAKMAGTKPRTEKDSAA